MFFFLSFISLRYLILHDSPSCAHPHSLHGSSPEGGSTMTLQPGANSAIQHKWPLRPGVQVHVNGPNSLSLAASGSVLLSPTDQSSNSSGSRPSSAGSEVITQTNSGQSQRNGSSDKQQAAAAAGNHPYYETLREKKKRSGGGSSGNATTDSGSESTRSVIRVQGPNRTAKSTAHSAPPPPPSLHQHPTSHQRMSSGTNKKLVRLSNKVPN